MTSEEAQAWKAFTQNSIHKWVVDPCHDKPENLLLHFGGENGKFATVRDKVVTVGTYEGAIPHIGEACFKIEGTKECGSNELALKFLFERGGIGILRAYLEV